MFLLIFGIFLICFLYLGVYKPTLFWKNKNIPYEQPVPPFGNAWRSTLLIENFIYSTQKLYKKFESERYFGMFVMMQPALCIRDLDLIKQITIKDFDHFTDHTSVIEPEADLAARNLLNMKGNHWRRMRATLSPVFTSSKMRGMFLLMAECAKDVTEYLRAKNEEELDVDLKELFTKYTNDVIATTAFGIKCDSLRNENNEFYRMGKKVISVNVGSVIRLLLYFMIPRVMKMLKINMFPKDVTNFFHGIVMETKKVREEKKIHRPDMLELLFKAQKGQLEHEDEADVKEMSQTHCLTDEDITAQALVFFLAGFDTASTALSFMLLELAIHQEIQEKLQREIDDVLVSGEVTYERVLKMSYLDQVLSETLRKWPPAFQTDRICTKEYTIPAVQKGEHSLTLDKGCSIAIPIISIHYDAKYFPDPERFDPERFSEENKSSLVPGSYMPFGVGPRNCIGSRFALLEVKIMAVYLLSKFNVVPTEKTKIPIRISPKKSLMTPDGGFWVALKSRRVTAL